MMNLFAYRLPGKQQVMAGGSVRLVRKRNVSSTPARGFIISPFDGSIANSWLIPFELKYSVPQICALIQMQNKPGDGNGAYAFPTQSTDKVQHQNEIEEIKSAIKDGKLQKCIAARVAVETGTVDIHRTFESLCEAYPEAFVFLFHTARTGTWMGASPELLLGKSGDKIVSMALAGTRPAGIKEPWDDKNISEQRIVTDFIVSQLRECGLRPRCSLMPETRAAGPIEHLMTEIWTHETDNCIIEGLDIASVLSPTPALSGMPRDAAMELTDEIETFERGYYGGYVGPTDGHGNFSLYVNLRSMRIEPHRYCLYAGGGIVGMSEPESEWEETERKLSTLRNHIVSA